MLDRIRKGILSPVFIGYCVIFKVREEAEPVAGCPGPESSERPATSRSLKTQQHVKSPSGRFHWENRKRFSRARPGLFQIQIRSTFLVAGQSSVRRGGAPKSSRRANPRSRWSVADRCPLLSGLPRKEVIQPQLPLRLPCYDFTPVASPTFDGSFPYGLGHRLRVLLTPMV